jgi:UDP-N-acetylglucosamine acyltransferase
VGPYAVIDAEVVVGPGCLIGPHVVLTGQTVIGEANRFHAGCVIGDAPQDLKYKGQPTRLVIGDHNVFREHVTVHRSTTVDGQTEIGAENFFMANSHVGHNTCVGHRVILANGALLGGHVVVEDRAFISGNCLVHQFVRVGTLCMMQGGAVASQDVPPFTVATGLNTICGLNTVGLRRAGISSAERLLLRRLYRALFRSRKPLTQALAAARQDFKGSIAETLIQFVAVSKRGVCQEARRRSGASAALAEEAE